MRSDASEIFPVELGALAPPRRKGEDDTSWEQELFEEKDPYLVSSDCSGYQALYKTAYPGLEETRAADYPCIMQIYFST